MHDYTARRFSRTIFAVALFTGAAGFSVQSSLAQSAEPKTAEQVYKNVTQLKGTPAEQLVPSMQFIASSLGVECAFCHVQGKPEVDDKPAKKTARDMMAMTAAINKNSFAGQRQVTCYSCHHGSSHPANMPPVLTSDAPAHSEARATQPASAAPTAADILEKYVSALGGEGAIKKITSRVLKGTILTGGSETPIELFTKAPNKRISIAHNPSGDSFTAFDGTSGWMGNTGRPARDMPAEGSEAAGLDAEFYLGLRLKEIFTQLRPGRPEEIRDGLFVWE